MAIAQLNSGRVPVKLWTKLEDVESTALDQLRNIASLPWVAHHVAVMPDVHFGKGATVGSVIAMRNAVCPAAVGVDIGCGMTAVKTSLTASDLPDNLEGIRTAIERHVPVGFAQHPRRGRCSSESYADVLHNPALDDEVSCLMNDRFDRLAPEVQHLAKKTIAQFGTLGGGNHFIELCLDTAGTVWLMLHSGSRNIGKSLGEVHMARAKWLAHNAELPDPDLAVFLAGTPEMDAYRRDLSWAQWYARVNRQIILALCQQALARALGRPHHLYVPDDPAAIRYSHEVSCHHNYVAEETHFGEQLIVTRKGAIRAGVGELGIIPGSMGAKSFIVRGLGNAESFESASHGAGRRMSRGAAKRRFTTADLAQQTVGVECRKDSGMVDEIPGAYKDIVEVMANQADLVQIVAELKQVLCVKG